MHASSLSLVSFALSGSAENKWIHDLNKKLKQKKAPERRTRRLLTRLYLIRILHYLQPNTYDHAVIQAAFTLAFAGLLRVGEFTYEEWDKELGASYQNWFLTGTTLQ